MTALAHEALFYRDAEDYVAGTVPFIEKALQSEEPVLVAVPAQNVALIRDQLGERAKNVRFIDMCQAGRNPGRIIPRVLLAFAAQHQVLGAPAANGHDVVPIRRAGARRPAEAADEAPGRQAADKGPGRCDGTRAAARRPSAAQRPAQAWIIGEPIWPGRTPTEYPACVQHEAMINVALAEAAATILCPYDASRLHPAVLADAERTHPVLVRRERKQPSALYADPAAVVDLFNRPFSDPPPLATSMVFDTSSLPQLRASVAEHAEAANLDQDRIAAFQLAANEVASNVLQHTAGPGTMRLWQENGRLVCEIRDSGHLSDRLAGRRLVASEANSEHGLVLVHSLCDLVQTYTHLSGTSFRLHMETG